MTEEANASSTSTKAKALEALRTHHHLSKRKRKSLERRGLNVASPEEIRASQIASAEKARLEKQDRSEQAAA